MTLEASAVLDWTRNVDLARHASLNLSEQWLLDPDVVKGDGKKCFLEQDRGDSASTSDRNVAMEGARSLRSALRQD